VRQIYPIEAAPTPESSEFRLGAAENRAAGLIVTYNNVTELRGIEERAEHLAAIVASAQEAIVGKDIHGVVTSWNAGAERLYGYTAEEAIGRPVAFLMQPNQVHELESRLQQVRRGETAPPLEIVRRHKDGRFIDVLL